MIVLDASACIEWLLGADAAEEVAHHLLSASTVHAPQLLSVEVTQVLRRYTIRDELDQRRATAALDDLADLDVAYHDHAPLLPAIWQRRATLTAYDAAYVALADVLDAPLLTLDQRLAAAPGADVEVVVPGRG